MCSIIIKEQIFDDKKLPTCHYLWFGPPSDGKSHEKYKISRAKEGHDLALVLETARKSKNPINFWGLEEFADHYIDRFKAEGLADKVKVQPIEQLIARHSEKRLY